MTTTATTSTTSTTSTATTATMTTEGAGGRPEDRLAARLRRILGGIRLRVVVGYVVLLALAFGIGILAIRQVLHSRLDTQIERDLAQEAQELRRLATGTNPETGEPFGRDAAAVFSTFLARNVPAANESFYAIVDGAPFLRSLDAPQGLVTDEERLARWSALTTTERSDLVTDDGQEARVLVVPLLADGEPQGSFVVAFFPEAEHDEVDEAMRTVTAVSAVVVVIASLLAWTLAGQVLRPVRDLTRTAQRISETDLESRIPVSGNDELAQLSATFNDMLDRLQAAFAGQREFLDDVAHELRTPITIARGHLELLGDDPEERAETVALVTDELDRMGRYVADLLVLAKQEAPDFFRLEPVDLGDLVTDALAKVRTLADRRWSVDEAPASGAVWLLADRERLNQALVNLVANAVEHTGAGDVVALGGRLVDGEVRLWVRDSGPGVDPAVRERIFDRFVRADASQAARPGGSGLGLAIVAAIARGHRGRVEVGEAPGGGALFTLVLPHTDDDDPTEEVA
jgi:signal transduction histidine kinase